MGIAISKLRQTNASHVPAYQNNRAVSCAAVKWQAAREQRMKHLSLVDFSFATGQGMEIEFTLEKELELRYEFS